MRSLCLVLVGAGCGFSANPEPNIGEVDAPPGPMIDAPSAMIDAPLSIDAPPDAPPVWTVIATMTVPCTAQVVTSPVPLVVSEVYRLRAAGECITNSSNGSRADADFFGYNIGQTYDSFDGVDSGIAINDTTPGAAKLPVWGAFDNANHDYEVEWTGAGTTITAMFHTSSAGNNSGSLTLQILRYQ
jgi:hypothetical protein